MEIGLYQAASGMKALWDQQQVITDNLARSAVAGHRATNVAFKIETPTGSKELNSNSLGISGLPVTTQPFLNFSQGTLVPSSSPFHLAIQGTDSFFTIQQPDGKIAYTRNGAFEKNADGDIVLNDGSKLLAEGGAPLNVGTDGKDITISNSGEVMAGNTSLGKISFTRFTHPLEDIPANGSGHFVPKEGAATESGLGPLERVSQGHLEQSNEEPVHQMVSMIEVMRAYEANKQILTTQDDTTGRLLSVVAGS